jgi:hypothetical protein
MLKIDQGFTKDQHQAGEGTVCCISDANAVNLEHGRVEGCIGPHIGWTQPQL